MEQRIRSLIIEDELYDRQLIEKILTNYFAETIEIVGAVDNAMDAIQSIRSKKPQLLFMDIELNGDRKGAFHILDQVEHDFRVIFVTAKSEQDDLLKAIRLSCTDYLVKPTKISDFEIPVKKAYEQINNAPAGNLHKILTFSGITWRLTNIQEARLSLQEGFSYRPIAVKNIIRCESQGNYTRFIFPDKTNSLANGNLKSFEERLSSYGFCRITKTDLINLAHIRTFSRRSSTWELLMNDNSTRYVSPNHKQHFLMLYNNMYLI